ncbi:glycoside hydrolase family protein [Pontiella sulfatireligans]|uniref:Iota-carrageenase n=1 Tax=Pontiella sulfatireligans TaxID=2750658 RepID=A0A6C2UEG3_9BACT|nr:hypothetical protein [Pontiella sulfatireligans]VGO18545.1 Iota-carrageenase [Pontiella sulfatireligans]
MKHILLILVFFACIANSDAAYTEVMKTDGPEKNLKTDYHLVDDNAEVDQSDKLQKAIDEMSEKGGGRLIIPKGTYQFFGVAMKSNVHILLEQGTVIRPSLIKAGKVCVLTFVSDEGPERFVENVSIRGLNGRYTIDFSQGGSLCGARFIRCERVRNFLIADADIRDSQTGYSAMNFCPSKVNGANTWEVFRPTNGTVRDCSLFNSHHGYGLVQFHGAENLLFENLYSRGGITLRFETGSGGDYAGVFDITGKNIVNENGETAVALYPHAVQNGNVWIDGVTAISSGWAVSAGGGGPPSKKDMAKNPDSKPGRFGDDSYVINVHAIFGKTAQIAKKGACRTPKEYIKDLKVPEDADGQYFEGASIGVVHEGILNDTYQLRIENVTSEGFKYNDGIVRGDQGWPEGSARRRFAKELPGYEEIAARSRARGEYKKKLAAEKAANKTKK